jgi:hypothetical protein
MLTAQESIIDIVLIAILVALLWLIIWFAYPRRLFSRSPKTER